MKIDIRLARHDEIAEARRLEAERPFIEIDLLAPIRTPKESDIKENPWAFETEGIGAHGAYEDSTKGRDFYEDIFARPFSIYIWYPIQNPVMARVSGKEGNRYSTADLISTIKECYAEIYRIENGKNPPPLTQKLGNDTLYARQPTQGMFGIWGNDIGHLIIEGIEVRVRSNGEMLVSPLIGS